MEINTLKNSYIILIPSLSRGGAESMAYQYGEHLKKKGHIVKYLLIEDRIDSKYRSVNYELIESKSIISSIRKFKKLKLDKDVIFISLIPLYTIAFLISRWLSFKFHSKVIYTVHNNVDKDFGMGFINRVIKFIYKKLLMNSGNVYSVSNDLNKQLINHGINSNVLINKSNHVFLPVNREPGSVLEILMVGRIAEQKDYMKSLEYLCALQSIGVDFLVNIYGEGPLQPDIEYEAELLGLSDKIIFNGYEPDIEGVIANNRFNILLLTSKYEGFGLVLIEALSKCIFPIARNCDFGPEEIIKNRVGALLPYDFSKADVQHTYQQYLEWANECSEFQHEKCFEVFNEYQKMSSKSWSNLELHR
ncbi:MAG: glycosyltransferase involved in cell wall biosynthesis [Psychroserpens sp.]